MSGVSVKTLLVHVSILVWSGDENKTHYTKAITEEMGRQGKQARKHCQKKKKKKESLEKIQIYGLAHKARGKEELHPLNCRQMTYVYCETPA